MRAEGHSQVEERQVVSGCDSALFGFHVEDIGSEAAGNLNAWSRPERVRPARRHQPGRPEHVLSEIA